MKSENCILLLNDISRSLQRYDKFLIAQCACINDGATLRAGIIQRTIITSSNYYPFFFIVRSQNVPLNIKTPKMVQNIYYICIFSVSF